MIGLQIGPGAEQEEQTLLFPVSYPLLSVENGFVQPEEPASSSSWASSSSVFSALILRIVR